MSAAWEMAEPSTRHGLSIRIEPHRPLVFEGKGTTTIETSADIKEGADERARALLDESYLTDEDRHRLTAAHQEKATVRRIHLTADGTHRINVRASGVAAHTLLITTAPHVSCQLIVLVDGSPMLYSEDIRVTPGPGASVELVTVQTLQGGMGVLSKRVARIAKDATVHWRACELGGGYIRQTTVNQLHERGGNGTITVVFGAAGTQRLDLHTASDHVAPSTSSDIVTKGFCAAKAKALSRGLVKIGEDAAGSSGYEQQDLLLLDPTAEGDAIPNLMIHNHDVTCSHGSTIGQLDRELLFYLRSRGLDLPSARAAIVAGYMAPVLTRLPPALHGKIEEGLAAALQR